MNEVLKRASILCAPTERIAERARSRQTGSDTSVKSTHIPDRLGDSCLEALKWRFFYFLHTYGAHPLLIMPARYRKSMPEVSRNEAAVEHRPVGKNRVSTSFRGFRPLSAVYLGHFEWGEAQMIRCSTISDLAMS